MNAHDENLAMLSALIAKQQPRYQCHRCGFGPDGYGFTRNEIRVMWRRDGGELQYIEACHQDVPALEREGWHEQL